MKINPNLINCWVVAAFSCDKSINLYKNLHSQNYYCSSEGKPPTQHTEGNENREEEVAKFKELLKKQMEKKV